MRQDAGSVACSLAVPKEYNMKTTSAPVKEFTVPLTDEEVNLIGEDKYRCIFASGVDTDENKGKFFVLDVITNEYEVGDDLLTLLKNAKQRSPDDNIYVKRIGFNSVFKLH